MNIGILTSFTDLLDYYSLTRVVLDQALMIHLAGHKAVFIATETFPRHKLPTYVELRAVLPAVRQIDYRSQSHMTLEHKALVPKLSEIMSKNCADLRIVFTHDIVFTGWHLPYNLALRQTAELLTDTGWLHWVHSVPSTNRRDFWLLPANSKLVYPNYSDRVRCAEAFQTIIENVVVVPHSLDVRQCLMHSELAKEVFTRLSASQVDYVQVLPVATDRMEHKGVDTVIKIFGKLKKLGSSVRLIICNSWGRSENMRSKVASYEQLATQSGLGPPEVAFSSQLYPEMADGLDNATVCDLMRAANLFIYPSQSETFALVVAEAALAGQLLVLNSSLPAMHELAGPANAIFFAFGSYQQRVEVGNQDKYYEDIAKVIACRFRSNEALMAKTAYRKKYCFDAIWRLIDSVIQTEYLCRSESCRVRADHTSAE